MGDAMTTRVEEIEERLQTHVNGWNWQERVSGMRRDIAYLLGEVKRLEGAESLALSLAEALDEIAHGDAPGNPFGMSVTQMMARAKAALSSPALIALKGK